MTPPEHTAGISPGVTVLAASIGTVITDRLVGAAVALAVAVAGQILVGLLRPTIDALALRLRRRISPTIPPPPPEL